MSLLTREFIKEKRDKKKHSASDIQEFIGSYVDEKIPDYQMSAWLMAVYLNGLEAEESAALTQAMLRSGYQFNFQNIPGNKVDKHSTGGVGDKTTMILAPIAAACGVPVPMIAGRGLGHTGGTLDKLESIPGFKTQISKEQFIQNLGKIGFSIMGQTSEICPADKRIYALRDVVATIESIELICASIMSKKLAEGIQALVLDVKVGNGAFMKDLSQAELLAKSLKEIGERNSCKVHALITDMNQPLGRHIGNQNEIYECVEILKNSPESQSLYADCRELSLILASHMISLSKEISLEEARSQAESSLASGAAYQKFLELVVAHGGRAEFSCPEYDQHICAEEDGYLTGYATEAIGIAGIRLGAGRAVVSDEIDFSAGIYVHKKLGEKVYKGDKIFSLYSSKKPKYSDSMAILKNSFSLGISPVPEPELVKKVFV